MTFRFFEGAHLTFLITFPLVERQCWALRCGNLSCDQSHRVSMCPQGSDLMDCEMDMAAIASDFQIECVYFDHAFTSVMHTYLWQLLQAIFRLSTFVLNMNPLLWCIHLYLTPQRWCRRSNFFPRTKGTKEYWCVCNLLPHCVFNVSSVRLKCFSAWARGRIECMFLSHSKLVWI